MKTDNTVYQELAYLTLLLKEGKINDQQFGRLESLLRTNEFARRCYVMLVNNDLYLYDSDLINCFNNEPLFGIGDLYELADYEKTAPEIKIPKEEPQRELIQKVIYPPREKRKLSKFNKIFLALNAAAILFFFLFLRFAPPKGGIEVATLADSINAKWADAAVPIEKGTRIVNGNEYLLLREGYAELLFDNQARVTIEGPAEFQIVADDRISLNYGKLYSQVPREAIGFSVYTKKCKIIDMGTEFGVEVDFKGETQLHVIQGQTKLISGQQSDKISIEVREGEARKISAATSEISSVACNSDLFIRKIDSKVGLIWKGQKKINLANIVGGGNGFHSSRPNAGIDTATGKVITDLLDDVVKVGSTSYKTVTSSPFIDGVFVPGLEDGMTSITADGSISVEFPKTSGNYWAYIFNGAFHVGDKVPRHTLQLNGKAFGTANNPSISIHSNQGITFDLSKIRQNTPIGKITEFRSLIGISETVKNYVDEAKTLDMQTLSKTTFSSVDFWVFLDGRKVYELAMSNSDEPVQVEIPISAQDRFLTLAVTEADDGWAFDWALFGHPELIIDPTK